MKSAQEKLADKVSDFGALSVMALFFSGLSFFACTFFLLKTADREWNAVQVSLTVFEVFLVIALAVGFWSVRKEAIDRAENAAMAIAKGCAEEQIQKYVNQIVAPKLVRAIIEQSEDFGGGENLTEQRVDDMLDALE